MTLAYPIATSADTALTSPVGEARTRYEAAKRAGTSVTLETEWLKPSQADLDSVIGLITVWMNSGAAQKYEGTDGRPVFALNYWKMKEAPQTDKKRAMQGEGPKSDDHADDLYFRKGRTKKIKGIDPDQMDLFD